MKKIFSVFVALLCTTAQANYIESEGNATIQSGQLIQAKKQAISDALRKAALSQKANLISNSMLDSHGQLHETVILKSNLSIQKIDILEETSAGKNHYVKAGIHFLKDTDPNSCSSNRLRKQVAVKVIRDGNITSDATHDLSAVLRAASKKMNRLIQNESGFVLKKQYQYKSYYGASFLPSNGKTNTQLITIMAKWHQPDRMKNITYDLYRGLTASFNYLDSITRLVETDVENTLPVNKEFKLSVVYHDNKPPFEQHEITQIFEALPVDYFSDQNAARLDHQVEAWLTESWQQVKSQFNCQPPITHVSVKAKSIQLQMGSMHNITIGQLLLVLPLNYIDDITEKLNSDFIDLFKVISVKKNSSLVIPLGRDLSEMQPLSEQKFVIAL